MCVYCRDDANASEELLACSDCQAAFHRECWGELERCTTPGCTGRIRDRATVCLHCDRHVELLDGLLKCSDCAAVFHWECWRERGRCTTTGCAGAARAPNAKARAAAAVVSDWGPVAVREPPRPPRFTEPGWLEAWAQRPRLERAFALSGVVGLLGLVAGLVIGFCVGGVFNDQHRQFSFGGALEGLLLCIPATGAGLAYGFLQGLIGLRAPMPKGLGIVSFLIVVPLVVGGAIWGGASTAIALGVVASLICGRLFGFHPGDNRR